MFTGIIQSLGKVIKYDKPDLWIDIPFRGIKRGESISVEGVCLTVAGRRKRLVRFHVGPATTRVTSLGQLGGGSTVNLERAMRYGERMGGHWVTGHVEHTGRIEKILTQGRNHWMFVALPREVRPYVVAKGSLSVDGISLTVVSVQKSVAQLMIIPHTWMHTTLRFKTAGDRVNLEPDILAKYARGQIKRLPR